MELLVFLHPHSPTLVKVRPRCILVVEIQVWHQEDMETQVVLQLPIHTQELQLGVHIPNPPQGDMIIVHQDNILLVTKHHILITSMNNIDILTTV